MDKMERENQIQKMVVANMVAIGGREWQKIGMHRVYFNMDVTVPALGLDLSFYNTGNISHASLNGETISNSKANRILHAIDGKFWYDVVADKWFFKGISRDYAADIKNGIMSKLAGGVQ